MPWSARKNAGLDVEGIMDAGQSQDARTGAHGIGIEERGDPDGVPKTSERHHAYELLVTDNAYALGSYNWTESATELNDEVLDDRHGGTVT